MRLRAAIEAPGPRGLALLVAAALVTRASSFAVPFYSGDEATYSALAVRILSGALPYAGAVDHKPVGMELTYALVYALVGRYRLLFVRALLVLVVAATGAAVAKTAELLDGRAESRWAGFAYVVASAVGIPGDMLAANTELFLNLPLTLAALLTALALRRPGVPSRRWDALRLLLAGALTALATTYKYQAALGGAAWALAVFTDGGGARRVALRLVALAAGFLVLALPYLAFFHRPGLWDPFLFWGWNFNFAYMGTLSLREMAQNGALYTLLIAAFWAPLVASAALARRPSRLAVLWLSAMGISILAGGRFFPHYYLMALPPLSVLAAKGASEIARHRRWSAILGTLGAVAFAGSMGAAWFWYSLKPRLKEYHAAYSAVGDYVRYSTVADERIFVWGNSPEIYYLSNRVMGTRFPFCNYHTGKIWGSPFDEPDAVGTEAHIVGRAFSELMEDLARSPPRLIIDGGAGKLDRWERHPIARYPELARLIAARYRLDATVAGVPIFRRVD